MPGTFASNVSNGHTNSTLLQLLYHLANVEGQSIDDLILPRSRRAGEPSAFVNPVPMNPLTMRPPVDEVMDWALSEGGEMPGPHDFWQYITLSRVPGPDDTMPEFVEVGRYTLLALEARVVTPEMLSKLMERTIDYGFDMSVMLKLWRDLPLGETYTASRLQELFIPPYHFVSCTVFSANARVRSGSEEFIMNYCEQDGRFQKRDPEHPLAVAGETFPTLLDSRNFERPSSRS
ncbi:MAG: hypothetical protein AAF439_13110 [Pseudomonadota bacterium]